MKFISILIAILLVSVNASILPTFLRQATPDDAIGEFTRAGFFGGSCLQTIAHTETVNDQGVIPHAVMTAQGTPCNDGGNMTVLADADAAKEFAKNEQATTLINAIEASGEDVIYAVEKIGRKCGSKLPLGKNTLVIILLPSKDQIIGLLPLKSNLRYMVVDDPAVDGFCFYRASLRPTPTPVPTDPVIETPAPTDDEGPITPTVAPTAGPGTGGVIPSGPGGDGVTEPSPVVSPLASPGIEGGVDGLDTPEPSASPDDDDDDDDICFPHDATVELEDGTIKTMDQIQVGDRVRVSDNTFSDVFMFTHKNAGVKHDFVRLTTHSGETITATRGHYLYIDGRFAAAITAKVGNTLQLANGALTTISDVSIVMGSGLYNPQTVHGDIIVNGIRASTFTTTIEPPTAQAMLAPLRMMFEVFGLSSSVFDHGADQIASYFPRGQLTL